LSWRFSPSSCEAVSLSDHTSSRTVVPPDSWNAAGRKKL